MAPPSCYRKSLQQRLLPEDWHSNNSNVWAATAAAREAAVALRHQAWDARNKAHTTSTASADRSTSELIDRAYEIDRVRQDLERHLQQVECELEKAREAKTVAEAECEARVAPIEVALQCLAIRERRREVDLVKDDLESSLHLEASVVQSSRSSLEKLALEALARVRELEDSKADLLKDLMIKQDALTIDKAQALLTAHHSEVSFKPDPLPQCSSDVTRRTVARSGGLSLRDWLDHSTDVMRAAVDSVRRSQDTRGAVCAGVQSAKVSDEHQQRSTDFALRRRRHEEQLTYDDLLDQKRALVAEASVLETEIDNLEKELGSTCLLLKRVQTRLEERKARPGYDLVADHPHDALCDEERELRETRSRLRGKLAHARTSLHELQQRLRVVDHDLGIKSVSLDLEEQVDGVRKQLRQPAREESQTEKNLALTGSLRHHPTRILL